MRTPEWLTLCWNGQPLGRITGIQVYDWPWACGRFVPSTWPENLRAAIEWLARQAESDDDLVDPPYAQEFYENWSVEEPSRTVREIGVPIINFVEGRIEWR